MKKIKIIEAGILDKNEMTNTRGGDTKQCGWWAYFTCYDSTGKYKSCQGTNHRVKCSNYSSCTPIKNTVCQPYDGQKGPGGIIDAMRINQG